MRLTIRLARSAADVDKRFADFQQLKAAQAKEIYAAFAVALVTDTRDRLSQVKSPMDSFSAGVEELAKAQKNSLAEIEKRDTISGEWYRAFQTALNSSVFARIDNREEIEGFFYQADSKVNALRALVFRFGATGDTKLVATIGHNKTNLQTILKQTRDKGDDKKLHELVDVDCRVIDVGNEGVANLAEIVRRDRRCHANGNSSRAVNKQVGKLAGQNPRFLVLLVVIRLEVDRV